MWIFRSINNVYNEKVLLLDYKRHTTHHIASTHSSVFGVYSSLSFGGIWDWDTPSSEIGLPPPQTGVPPSRTGIPHLGLGYPPTETGVLPGKRPETRNQGKNLGTEVPPRKGPGTREQGKNLGLGYHPFGQTGWCLWKHYLPVILLTRAVITRNAKASLIEGISNEVLLITNTPLLLNYVLCCFSPAKRLRHFMLTGKYCLTFFIKHIIIAFCNSNIHKCKGYSGSIVLELLSFTQWLISYFIHLNTSYFAQEIQIKEK